MKATEVTEGLAESNGSLLPRLWRDSLHVICGLTACTPGSAPTLGNEYGKTLPFFKIVEINVLSVFDEMLVRCGDVASPGRPFQILGPAVASEQ